MALHVNMGLRLNMNLFRVVLFLGFFATTFSSHGRIDAGIILLF
jgi:hypothetical protein